MLNCNFLKNCLNKGISLICYTDKEASQYKFCNEDDGFRSCYASYDKGEHLKVDALMSKVQFIFKVFYHFRWAGDRAGLLH